MPILTETFEGSPEGMNVALPAQELPDTQARYMQDILIDYPGLIRRRGPTRKVEDSVETAIDNKAIGIVQTLDPAGTNRIALLHGKTGEGKFGFLSTDWTTKVDVDFSKDDDIAFVSDPPTNPYRAVDAKQARGGGVLIGVSDKYGTTTDQALALWRGARKADYNTGTITVALNSKTITGASTVWNANVEPGMFLFTGASAGTPRSYIGTVKSVDGDTQLTLEQNALVNVGASGVSYALHSRRGIVPKVMKGRITCTTGAATVTGANTKFKDQKVKDPAGDTWLMFKLSDMTYIGTVTSVQTNTALTLTANAAQALSNERYVAFNANQHWGVKLNLQSGGGAVGQKVGFLNAVYAERQWYANRGADIEEQGRMWFSDPTDLEGLDLSTADGDFINFGTGRGAAAPIRSITAAYNALIVLKEDDAWALRGSTPSTFSVTKLHDDGTLGGMSAQAYGGGVLWAGRDGINYYNGIEVENITQDRLGDYYKNLVRHFDPSKYRMWSMLVRDHYFLFIEDTDPSIAVIKGAVASQPSTMTIAIYMPTRGVTVHTNLDLRGSITLPAESGESTWYVVNGYDMEMDVEEGPGGDPPTSFNSSGYSGDYTHATEVIVSDDMWAGEMMVYCRSNPSLPGDSHIRLAIYDDNSSAPGALLAQTDPILIEDGTTNNWVGANLQDTVHLPAGTYWAALQTEHTDDRLHIWGNSGPLAGYFNAGLPTEAAYSTGLPQDWGTTYNGGDNMAIRIVGANTEDVRAYICDAGALFDAEAQDGVGCEGAIPGPDFYYESKKFSAGDSLRKKLFKQLAIHYIAQGGALKLDTVIGLNDQGKQSISEFAQSVPTWDSIRLTYPNWNLLSDADPTWSAVTESVFKPKRIKFLKRSTHLSFRLYQSTRQMARVKLGPFQVGYKLQRPGRI